MTDLVKERGLPQGVAMSLPAFMGVGLQTYSPTPDELVHSSNSVLKEYKDLLKQGRGKQAQDLLMKNKDIVGLGKHFEPMQKVVNTYERLRKDAEENVRLSPQERKRLINDYTNKIKYYNVYMDNQLKEYKNKEHFSNWQKVNIKQKDEFLQKWGNK
jgi:hypothetical protein